MRKRSLARRTLSNAFQSAGLEGVEKELGKAWQQFLWRRSRKFGRVDREIHEAYLQNHEIRKLHLGCGYNELEGWLNTDLKPTSDKIAHLNATLPFPFSDGQFDYVFSEHMIEHITYPQGSRMLAECFRVLRPGGKIRVSTPDLQFVIDLHREDRNDLQERYLRFATERYLDSPPSAESAFVINHFVRAWHHEFIYDKKTLRMSLGNAGFTDLQECGLNESEDEALRVLEHEARLPEGLLRLQTMTFEGTKPVVGARG